jgi:hypothetical protein
MEMRASLAAVLCLGTGLMLSPGSAQTVAPPLPPDSQARTILTTSLLELLLALRLDPVAQPPHAARLLAPTGRPRDAALTARRQDEVTSASLTPP